MPGGASVLTCQHNFYLRPSTETGTNRPIGLSDPGAPRSTFILPIAKVRLVQFVQFRNSFVAIKSNNQTRTDFTPICWWSSPWDLSSLPLDRCNLLLYQTRIDQVSVCKQINRHFIFLSLSLSLPFSPFFDLAVTGNTRSIIIIGRTIAWSRWLVWPRWKISFGKRQVRMWRWSLCMSGYLIGVNYSLCNCVARLLVYSAPVLYFPIIVLNRIFVVFTFFLIITHNMKFTFSHTDF